MLRKSPDWALFIGPMFSRFEFCLVAWKKVNEAPCLNNETRSAVKSALLHMSEEKNFVVHANRESDCFWKSPFNDLRFHSSANPTRNRKRLDDWYCDPFRAPRERRWYSKCDFFMGDSFSLCLALRNFTSVHPSSPFEVSHQASPCWRWHFACLGTRLATITTLKTRFLSSFQLFFWFHQNFTFPGISATHLWWTRDTVLRQLARSV